MLLPALIALVLTTPPLTVSEVPCQTVADCWLDALGAPIARPAKQKGKAVPRGDCGKKLIWLQNRLSCEKNFCAATHIGDRC